MICAASPVEMGHVARVTGVRRVHVQLLKVVLGLRLGLGQLLEVVLGLRLGEYVAARCGPLTLTGNNHRRRQAHARAAKQCVARAQISEAGSKTLRGVQGVGGVGVLG